MRASRCATHAAVHALARRHARHAPGRSSANRCRASADEGSPLARLGAAFEDVKKRVLWELDFSNWAPRGARAYRLREIPRDIMTRDEDKAEATGELSVDTESDAELSEAVRKRFATLATAQAAANAAEQSQPGAPLTGEELASICVRKYGVCYDMAVKQVDLGAARFVALNLYCAHLGQRSFPFSEAEYLAKLDAVAYLINAFACAEFVRAFFRERIYPRAGLPSRPRVDTAVTLRLNASPTWDPELVETIFATLD